MSFVDLHLHLLPGVDDGARTLEESLAHARTLVADGVSRVAVTPHVGHPEWEVDPLEVPRRTLELQRELERAGIPLKLHPGGELHPARATSWSRPELEAIAHGPGGARWVLAEVPFAGIDEAFVESVRELRERGLGVLIAHPERAAGFLDAGLGLLRHELVAGALLQVNVCSLLGNNGREAQRGALHLVRNRLAFVVASDGHAPRRVHTVRTGFDLVRSAGVTAIEAWRLTQDNPRFLLRHGIPAASPAAPPVPSRRRDVARVLEQRRGARGTARA
jgi:protein-tyrosine phosphatase